MRLSKKINTKEASKMLGIKEVELTRIIDKNKGDIYLKEFIPLVFSIENTKTFQFREWIIDVLDEYLTKGYVIDEDAKLDEHEKRLLELEKIIDVMRESADLPVFEGKEKDLFTLIEDYAETWNIFAKYDEGVLDFKNVNRDVKYRLTTKKARGLVDQFVLRMEQKGLSNTLFGREVDDKLDVVLDSINQTFDGKDLYPGVELKAAHILYLIIKDHPFVDGNKRVGSMLFLYYLEMNGFAWKASKEKKLNDNALVALALLVAASRPEEKFTMITLIVRLLQNDFVNTK